MTRLHTSAKSGMRYDAGKTRAPRPGDLIVDADGVASEIRRVFARNGVGWKVQDARGLIATAMPGEHRGIWGSSPRPNWMET